jgi:tetratricopeptide (TPR) repeat protein
MNRGRWLSSLVVAMVLAGEARAQFVVPVVPVVPGGFGFGSRSGFGFQRRSFALSGFAGGFTTVGPYGFGPPAPFYAFPPYGYSRVTIINPPPVVAGTFEPRRRVAVEEDYDLSGVDLDLVHPDDLLKPRAELERIMAEKKRQLAIAPPRKRIAPPADVPPAPAAKKVPEIKKPPEVKKPAPPPRPPDEIRPGEEYKRLLEIGQEAFQQQLYGVAAQRFAQAAKFDARQSRSHFLLSQAKFALGRYAEAVRAIEQGMRLQKDWPLAKFQPRLELYKDNDDYVGHLKRLEDVLAAEPKNADFLFLLAHELWFAGFRERAVELFRRARPLAADPAFIDIFLRAAPPAKIAAN